jgi:transcriptional regulator GlxA family with amidase domain
MRQHLSEPLQVATLAAQAGTSPSHFFVVFKRFTGCSPIDYFIRLRMRRACQLLETGPLSVKDIAVSLGYEDPFYFSRVFKSVHRLAPSHYRAQRVFSSSRRSGTIENR